MVLMRTIAAFDFDGTLTTTDSLFSYLSFVTGKPAFYLGMLKTLPDVIQFVFGQKTRQEVKEAFLSHTIGGIPYAECEAKGKLFATSFIDPFLKEDALKKLRWHQAEGHEIVIVSANLNLFLNAWTAKWNLPNLLCTRVANIEGKVTGNLVGANCWGEEKVRRLLEWANVPKEEFTLWAYGDSRGDKELLELADHPFLNKF